MLIVLDDEILNLNQAECLKLKGTAIEISFAGRNAYRLKFDTEADARQAYNRIIDALKVGERILDLRRSEQ